jgi:hypothetical protein
LHAEVDAMGMACSATDQFNVTEGVESACGCILIGSVGSMMVMTQRKVYSLTAFILAGIRDNNEVVNVLASSAAM